MRNISDLRETSTITFPITALLFESNLVVDITNNYTVSNGGAMDFGNFYGKWVNEAGISMPRDSQFVTIAVPLRNLTATQKLVVNWFDRETQERGTAEFDLIVNLIS